MKMRIKAAISIILLIAISSSMGAGLSASARMTRISVRYGINIRVNGILFQPVDSRGNPVEPFIYRNTTYVPLRAISGIFGADVDWEGSSSTVILGSNITSSIDTSNFNQNQMRAYNLIEQAKALIPTMKYNWKFLWDSSDNMSRACYVGGGIRTRNNIPTEDWNKTEELCDYATKYCNHIQYLAPQGAEVAQENRIMLFDYNNSSMVNDLNYAETILFAINSAISRTQGTVNEVRDLDLESWVNYINDLAIRYNYHERVEFKK